MNLRTALVLGFAATFALQGRAHAELLHAVTVDNRILTFHASAPGTILTDVAISSIGVQESILGLDYRPATQDFFALGDTGVIHRIDPFTGTASPIAAVSESLVGGAFGVDFNPVADRLRIISDSGQNLRVVPDTGVALVDGAISYLPDDVNAGVDPNLAATAYTNSFGAPSSTMQFGIDSELGILARVTAPNEGTLSTIGSLGLGFDVSDIIGFDISGFTGIAYAAFTEAGASESSLYTIDLATGSATLIGAIGGGSQIRSITVQPIPEPAAIVGMGLGISAIGGLMIRRRFQAAA